MFTVFTGGPGVGGECADLGNPFGLLISLTIKWMKPISTGGVIWPPATRRGGVGPLSWGLELYNYLLDTVVLFDNNRVIFKRRAFPVCRFCLVLKGRVEKVAEGVCLVSGDRSGGAPLLCPVPVLGGGGGAEPSH